MIMHAWSNTSKQREKLPKEIFATVIKIARESETKQEDLYSQWKVITYDTRTEQHQNKSVAKTQKELAVTMEKEKQSFQIDKS